MHIFFRKFPLLRQLDFYDSDQGRLGYAKMIKDYFYSECFRSSFQLSHVSQYDLVWCSNVIEHNKDPESFLRELILLNSNRFVVLSPLNEVLPEGSQSKSGHVSSINEDTYAFLSDTFHIRSKKFQSAGAWIGDQLLVTLERKFSK